MINQEIHPNQLLDRAALRRLLGLTDRAIGREISAGRLKCHWRINKQWFLGYEVFEWIRGGKQFRGPLEAEGGSDEE